MTTLDKVLGNLAGLNTKDDLSQYDALPLNLQEALKAKIADQQKQAASDAADLVLDLLNRTQALVNTNVENIRNIRKQIDRTKNVLERIERAKQYGLETQNFLPLAYIVGSTREPHLVPEGWVSKNATTKTTRKATTRVSEK
ncbi:hypothetical protein [Ralstonia phage RP13]|nr:hypothetical protein [Ralstonia phage RP13]